MDGDGSMSEKGQLIARARQLGREYMGQYGCAEATMLAVADALNMPVSDDVFKGTVGLSSMSGGCGGFCGAIVAMGLRFGRPRDTYHDPSNPLGMGKWYRALRQAAVRVRDRFVSEYGGSLCCNIQDKLFGQSFNFLDLDSKDMQTLAKPENMRAALEMCRKVTENAAGWTVEAILETEAATT